MKKFTVKVFNKGNSRIPNGEPIEVIKRVLRAEAIGNFNPIFCTYKGKRCLVKSEEGDISDPFRRNESYLNSLFIEIE